MGGKGWSLRLRGGQCAVSSWLYAGRQRLEPWPRGEAKAEPSLRREAKAGAFAYAGGKGWSLRLH